MFQWLFELESWEKRSVFAWRFNVSMDYNAGWIIYGCILGAVILQQFRITEPIAAGFFWINFFSLILSIFLGGFFHNTDFRSVMGSALGMIIGITTQLYLIIFQWGLLCTIDDRLRFARESVFGDHRIPGWTILAASTALVLYKCKYTKGYIFHIPSQGPPYSISYVNWWDTRVTSNRRRR